MNPVSQFRTARPRAGVVLLTILCAALIVQTAAAQEKWTRLSPVHVPEGRDDAMMAFDSIRGVVVMFGGDRGGSGTWIWDGIDWKDLGISGPAARREAAMVFDSKRGKIVMFGGYDFTIQSSLTWEFDGTAWAAPEIEEFPDGRSDHAMAFDEARGVCVMFGGELSDDSTWLYDGTAWTEITSEDVPSPGSRWGHCMAYDSARQRVVLFGGANEEAGELDNDTWEWDGAKWTEVTPASGNPPGMREAVMVYDAARQKTVLFGGRDLFTTGFDQTWEWDGVAWTEVSTDSQPSERHEAAAAYDAWRHRTILFGGSSGDLTDDRYKDDTWVYPNLGPSITHTASTDILLPGTALTVSAHAIDYDADAISVRLYYRTTGAMDYESTAMTVGANNTYSAPIPAEVVQKPGVEYYLSATDANGSGLTTLSGSASSPYAIAVADTGTLQVFLDPLPARKKGARWKISGTKEWRKNGEKIELPPGTVVIVFNEVERWTRPTAKTVTISQGQGTVLRASYTK